MNLNNEKFEKGPQKSLEEKRKEFLKSFLNELRVDGRKDVIKEGELATVIDGPFAHIGMKVMWIEENGKVHLRPSPDTSEVVEYPEKELFSLSDFHFALSLALQAFPEAGSLPDKTINVEISDQSHSVNLQEKYETVKVLIHADLQLVSTSDLDFFLEHLSEDDFETAAKVYSELKTRGEV